MKKLKPFTVVSILALVLALIPAIVRAATEKEALVNVDIPESQTIDDNFVQAGNAIDIRGTVNGDCIVAGSTVDISGKVTGDVLAAAGVIRISGEVSGDVRVVGGTFELTGKVDKNVNVFSGSAVFGKDSKVGGGVAFGSGSADFKGEIAGNIYGGASTVSLSGKTGKDVNLKYNYSEKEDKEANVQVTDTAVIGGNFDYSSNIDAEIGKSAQIAGAITRHPQAKIFQETSKFFNSFWWFARLVSLFGIFVLGLIVVSIFKNYTKKVTDLMTVSSGKSMLLGLLILLLTPLASILLMFTIIGIPLAVILLIIYGLAIYMSKIFVGIFIGSKIISYFQKKAANPKEKKEPSLFWSMIIGLIIYYFVLDFILGFGWQGAGYFLGYIGGLIKLVLIIWSIGALFLAKRQELIPAKK